MASCEEIRIPESRNFLLLESGIPLTVGIQNPSSSDNVMVPGNSTWNLESKAWNPDSETVLDSLTREDISKATVVRTGESRRIEVQICRR